jgi:hypothetical protein
MTTLDVWASPQAQDTSGWQQAAPPAGPSRLREDLTRFVAVLLGTVLLGAPVGLLWSVVAPHFTLVFRNGEASYPFIESSKAFVGADGSFVAVTLGAGVVTGLLGWFLARRSGPWTVAALALGGALAALVAMRVGLLPGRQDAFDAIARKQGSVDLFLGAREGNDTHLRAQWSAVMWPVASLAVFLVAALMRPQDVD